MSLDLEYFYGNEAEQYSFYRIPKVLLTDHRYKGVSMEAKVLYGLMLDRMGLSIRSGWLDGDGRVYIYFTLEDAIAMLGCGKDKAVRLFKELDIGSGIGLIERRKQGQGKPARVYVKKFTLPPSSETPEATPPPTQTSEIPKSGLRGDSDLLTSEKPKSALLESSGQDFGKAAANKTDKNNTESSDTDLFIHPPAPLHASPPDGARHRLRMDEMDWYREVIRENIDYGLLCMERRYDTEEIDGYVELIAEICASGRGYIRVNGTDVPAELVKERFLKLNSEHIQYVMECLRSCTTQVVNIRAYILAALYNAPVTMDHYYTTQVSHDRAQSWGAGA